MNKIDDGQQEYEAPGTFVCEAKSGGRLEETMTFSTSAVHQIAQNGNGHHGSPIDLAPLTDWTALKPSDHFVQFYDQDNHLERAVASFIGEGLRASEAAIVIATAAHREAIEQRLHEQGIDVEAEQVAGNYFLLDAAQTLTKYMFEGSPDARLFRQVIGNLVA